MIKYTLTLSDLGKAIQSASLEYNKYKTRYKLFDAKLEHFFYGKVGEIGYGKHAGLDVNFDFYLHKGDGGADFEKVQVKTVTWNGPDKTLKVKTNDKSLLDSSGVTKFVLMYVNTDLGGKEVHYVGSISKENFLKKSVLTEAYNTTVRILHEEHLDPEPEL